MSEYEEAYIKLAVSLGASREHFEKMAEKKRDALTPEEYLIDTPLYQEIPLEADIHDDLLVSLRGGESFTIDCHCVKCGREAPFKVKLNPRGSGDWMTSIGDASIVTVLTCQRDTSHSYTFYSQIEGAALRKTGQYPSMEDISGGELLKYRKILGEDFPEMRKAGGLISHGIGIGAFVYLRRIFERLIEQSRQEADPEDKHREAFYKLRMAEKVEFLKGTLPQAVVDYKGAYGVLSKGLHELSENECKLHFPVLRAAIMAMLEERFEAAEKRKAADSLKAAVAAAEASLGAIPGPKKT